MVGMEPLTDISYLQMITGLVLIILRMLVLNNLKRILPLNDKQKTSLEMKRFFFNCELRLVNYELRIDYWCTINADAYFIIANAYFIFANVYFIIADAYFIIANAYFINANVYFIISNGYFIISNAYFINAGVYFIIADA